MIKKLQRRFTRIAVIALTIAMVLVVAIVNIANWISVRSELNHTMTFLAENEPVGLRGGSGARLMEKNKHARNLISESNWFSAVFDDSGNLLKLNTDHMAEADDQATAALAQTAIGEGTESAFLQDYLYRVIQTPSGRKTIVFLNCETKIAAVRILAWISAAACLGGVLLALLIVSLASRRAVEPIIRNMEQQKQFITNASHELKTPLTVISTNMELLNMETPDNPWVRSTQKQTTQMRHLVDELVYLSRMEEENVPLEMEALNLSGLAADTAAPFADIAEYNGGEMRMDLEDPLYISGDRASIQRLITILCDNAVKYADEDGKILLQTKAEGRYAALSISNKVAAPLSREQCEELFNRFYRAEVSRNKEKQNGFGIGLAIAAAIAEKHGGSISAAMTSADILTFTCLLPIQSRKGIQEK